VPELHQVTLKLRLRTVLFAAFQGGALMIQWVRPMIRDMDYFK
jgi:hypothetical protein